MVRNFLSFIHDMDSTWKELAETKDLTIGNDTNTTMIVNDILSWAKQTEICIVVYEMPTACLFLSKPVLEYEEDSHFP